MEGLGLHELGYIQLGRIIMVVYEMVFDRCHLFHGHHIGPNTMAGVVVSYFIRPDRIAYIC